MTDEVLIIGGGIAGTCLARSLVDQGLEPGRLRILDAESPRRGSSAPATMLHAFPGRSMAVRGAQQAAFVESFQLLRRWQERFGGSWWQEGSMVRPFTVDAHGERLRTTWEQSHGEYPAPLTSEVLTASSAMERFPGLQTEADVVLYGPVAGVLLPEFLDAMKRGLRDEGVSLEPGQWRPWEVPDGTTLVLAMGAGLIPLFPGLDLRRKAGEVLVLDPKGQTLPVFVNGVGHLLQRPDGLWGLGSTYFPEAEWEERADEDVVEQLFSGIEGLFPSVREAAVVKVWRGERCIFGSDHRPLVGPVPGRPGVSVFGGLGSKGLLWGPSLSRALAEHILSDTPLPGGADARRVRAHRWAARQ